MIIIIINLVSMPEVTIFFLLSSHFYGSFESFSKLSLLQLDIDDYVSVSMTGVLTISFLVFLRFTI